MNVKLLTNTDAKPVLLNLIRTCDDIYIAMAWAGRNSVVDALIGHKGKLRNVVIGTHMYQTNPLVLRQLMPIAQAKCMSPDGQLFHPKVYLFKTGVRISALVGSHNLTASAFDGDNIEASMIVEGDAKEIVLRDLLLYVEKAWHRAEIIDEGFLFPYEKQYEANTSKRKLLTTFNRFKKPGPGSKSPSPLEITWTAFAHQVGKDRALTGRLRVLDGAAAIFRTKPNFALMNRQERRAIAGTYGRTEERLDNLPWYSFGNMVGQGDFQNLVNETPQWLSNALDAIPVTGEIQRRDYDSFVRLFQRAFKDKAHKGQIATASRLLAMKRPDVFVCVSSANRRGLCNAFGVARTTLSLANYWERIIVPIQLSPWWRHDRPRTHLGRSIWDNRAALLDCIYYDPRSKANAKK